MSMIQCPFCNAELPEDARFCGRCGRVIGERPRNDEEQPTVASLSGGEHLPTLYETPEPIDPNGDFAKTVDGSDSGLESPPKQDESFDRNLGVMTLFGESLGPQHGNVPMVHGTPQAGGVPYVQGTPSSTPNFQSPQHLHQGHQPHGFQPQQTQSPHFQQTPHQHGFQPQPSQFHQAFQQQGYQAQDQQQPIHLHASATHQQAAHVQHPGKPASRLAQRGFRPSILTTVISGAVVIITIASLAIFFFPGIRNTLFGHGQPPPALILNGQVVPGGLISLHGSNFTSGGTITITVDGHPATLANSSSSGQVSSDTPGLETYALGAFQVGNGPGSGSTVSARSDGSFDATVRLDANWPAGSSHMIVATEQSSGQSARMSFVIPQRSALSSCSKSTNNTTIMLGPVTVGQVQPVAAPFTLCSTGSGTVNWTASWNQQQASWLHLASSGKIQAPLIQQLQVSASANGLKAGFYQATVTFSSQGSSLKLILNVTFIVRLPNTTTCINTSTQTLSFIATQGQGNPATQSIIISNCGDPNAWTASTHTDDGANWLSTGSNSGTLQSKGTQNVPIRVTSTMLVAGTYTGQITFKVGASTATVNIILTIQPPAQNTCVIANPNTVGFTATQGQGDPGAQVITIGNCGSSGNWSASTSTTDGANWLSVSSTHGNLNANGTSNVSVAVTSAGLQNGTYTGQVTFRMGSSTATVSVFFDIQQMQNNYCISTNTGSLVFTTTQGQGDPDAQRLILLNCGTTGDWSVSSANNSNWLGVDVTHGHLHSGASQDILVAARTAQLHAGQYHDRLIFTLGTSTEYVDIGLVIQPTTDCIQANTQELNFVAYQGGDNPPAQVVTIGNCGGSAGDWSAQKGPSSSWLGFQATNGRLGVGATEDVKVGVVIGGLIAGPDHSQIIFTLGSSTVVVQINLSVQSPIGQCIQANPNALVFTATAGQRDPDPQTVTLTNCGSAGDWSASSAHGSNWLNGNPVNGHLDSQGTSGATQDVLVVVSIAHLDPGIYRDRITFALGTSSAVVDIQLNVQSVPIAPCIRASTDSLTFTATQGQGDPAPQMLTLLNCGSAGDWSASSANNSAWINPSLFDGHLEAHAMQDITVSVSASQLDPGKYNDTLIFTLGSATARVNVTLIIAPISTPPPKDCIQANPQSLTFTATQGQGDPAPQTVTLTNCGPAGDWSMASANNSGWLSVHAPNNHLEANATQDVSVSVSTGNLNPGINRNTLIFSLGGATAKVAITFSITQAPPPSVTPTTTTSCIKANTQSLTFTATQGQGDPAPQTVTITNCGSAGDWTVGSANNAPWLSENAPNNHLEPNVTQDVSVNVTNSNLNSGIYRDVIIFSLGGATAKVAVTFTIAEAPPSSPTPTQPPPSPTTPAAQDCIQASPSTLTFTTTQGQGDPQPQTVTLTNCGTTGGNWSVASVKGSSWLSSNLANGQIGAGSTQDVSVGVASSNLNPDTYRDLLIFSLGSAKVRVVVVFTIAAAAPPTQPPAPPTPTPTPTQPPTQPTQPPPPPAMPCIQANTNSLSFTGTQGQGDPQPQTVTISNCGDPGRWFVRTSTDDGANWLSTSANAGTLDGQATQDVNIAVSNSLAPGTYTGHVTFIIVTNGGTKSVTVVVTFTVS
jgi:hypothetical protein